MSRATMAGACWRPGWWPGWRRRWLRAPAVWRGSSVRHSGLASLSRDLPTTSWRSPSMTASQEDQLMSAKYNLLFSAAVSYSLAEQFSHLMELRGLQSAARMGRAQGEYYIIIISEKISSSFILPDSCDIIKCQFLDTELRSFTDSSLFRFVENLYNIFY